MARHMNEAMRNETKRNEIKERSTHKCHMQKLSIHYLTKVLSSAVADGAHDADV